MKKIRLIPENYFPELVIGVASVIFILWALLFGQARAADFMTINPMQGGGGVAVFSGSVDATAKIIHIPQDLSADAEAHAHAWEAFCQPTPVVGQYGVIYLHYAHEGCEFGRTE